MTLFELYQNPDLMRQAPSQQIGALAYLLDALAVQSIAKDYPPAIANHFLRIKEAALDRLLAYKRLQATPN